MQFGAVDSLCCSQSRLRAKPLMDQRLSVPIVAGQLAIQNAVQR